MARRTSSRTQEPKRVAVAMKEETAPERWLRTLRFSGFSAVALGLLILAVVVLAPSLRTLVEQQQQIAALERGVAARQTEVGALQSQLDRWSDPAYVESQARQRLLYARPGEVSYLVTSAPDEAAPDTRGLRSAELQSTRVDWLAALLSATYAAGLTQAPADDAGVIGGLP